MTILDSSGAISSSRKLLHQDLTAGAAEEDLSRVSTPPCLDCPLQLLVIIDQSLWQIRMTEIMRHLHRSHLGMMQGEKMQGLNEMWLHAGAVHF